MSIKKSSTIPKEYNKSYKFLVFQHCITLCTQSVRGTLLKLSIKNNWMDFMYSFPAFFETVKPQYLNVITQW